MTIIQIIRLLSQHIKLLIITPVLFLCIGLYSVMNQDDSFYSSAKIYTGFASGYNLNSNSRNDYFTIKTKFDNFFQSVQSRSVREDIAIHTLAYYFSLETVKPYDLSTENWNTIKELKNDPDIKPLLNSKNKDLIAAKLLNHYQKDYTNSLYILLNDQNSEWKDIISVAKLADLEAYQEQNSDVILVGYESKDAGLTYHILRIGLEILAEHANKIKSSETDDVVMYFLRESKAALDRLNQAEVELSKIMTENNITNYYEQTKWLASRNEDFELAFQQEKLGLAAAKAAEQEASRKLNVIKGVQDLKEQILDIREKIKFLSEKQARFEIETRFVADSTETIDSRTKRSLSMDSISLELIKEKQRLMVATESLFVLKNSNSGVEIKTLGNEWIEAVIQVEEFSARIKMYYIFRQEFNATYARLAKLGSKIKQLERKIAVCEKDYLDLLGSLNDAKLMRQNISMSSTFKTVDLPFYPVNSAESKKAMILVLSFFAGILLVLFAIILMEFFDSTIKTGARLNELTKTTTLSALPIFTKATDAVKSLTTKQFTSQLKTLVNIANKEEKKPFVIAFFSTRDQEGKSTLIDVFQKSFENSGSNVKYLDANTENSEDKVDVKTTLKKTLSDTSTDLLLLELPSLIKKELSSEILKSVDISVMVAKASRLWETSDHLALQNYKSAINHPIHSVLNGASLNELENMHGDLPKERSAFRKKIKSIFKLQFKNADF